MDIKKTRISKKILSLALCVLTIMQVICTTLAVPVSADNILGDFVYEYSNDLEGMIITGYYGVEEEVEIPERIAGVPVVAVDGAFTGNEYLQRIVIGNYITSILSDAFAECDNLSEVILKDSVETIGEEAFAYCSSLEKVEMGNSVTHVGNRAFYKCESLVDVKIGDSVIYIKDEAFASCTSLETVDFGTGVQYIGIKAFKDCTKLSNLIFSEARDLSIINVEAFANCYNIEVLDFSSVENINREAFLNCEKLQVVSFSDKLEQAYGFEGCPNIKDVYYPSSVWNWDYNVSCSESILSANIHFNWQNELPARPKLSSINISSLPDKTEYKPGEKFDKTGLVVELVYDDGSTAYITHNVNISGFDSTTKGIKTITVEHCGKTAEFKVNIKATPVSLLVLNKPDKTDYELGEELDTTGLVLHLTYLNGIESEEITDGYTVSGFDSSTAGWKRVTVEYAGKTNTFTVRVKNRVSWLDISLEPDKTVYEIGEELDITGLSVKAYREFDGYEYIDESECTFSGFDSSSPGIKKITVEYRGKTAYFYITVNEAEEEVVLSSISINRYPAKTEYEIGESLNTFGLKLKLTYSDGSYEYVTDGFAVSGFDSSSSGTKTIRVEYGGKITTFTVTVNEPEEQIILLSISVFSKPNKTVYEIGEELDTTGLKLKLKHSDNSITYVSDGFIVSGFNSNVAGTKTITVKYGDKSATFTVTVNETEEEVVLSSISINRYPAKTEYEIGESLDTTGLKLKLIYSDGSYEYVTDGFTTSGFGSSTSGEKIVTVKYGGKSTTFTVTIRDDTPDGIPFVDIQNGKWYTDSVVWCYKNGYMAGVSSNMFDYKGAVTRAMFATILAVIDGSDLSSYTSSSFADVPTDRWYSSAIQWAYQNGYAAGYSNGLFGRNDNVTREQIALFLYTYSALNGIDVRARAVLSGYNDVSRIHDYAISAVSWAVDVGLISGTTTTTISPRDPVSRAQMSLIIMNYIINVLEPTENISSEVWKNTYRSYLYDNQESFGHASFYEKGEGRFTLEYIDGDNIPELIIIDVFGDAMIYTCRNGRVVKIEFEAGWTDIVRYPYNQMRFDENGDFCLKTSDGWIVFDKNGNNGFVLSAKLFMFGGNYYYNDYDTSRVIAQGPDYIRDFTDREVASSVYNNALALYSLYESNFKAVTEGGVRYIVPAEIDRILG